MLKFVSSRKKGIKPFIAGSNIRPIHRVARLSGHKTQCKPDVCLMRIISLLVLLVSSFALAHDSIWALWYEGVNFVSLGEYRAAEEIFFKLLDLSPDFVPGADTSPKIMLNFHKAKTRFFKNTHNQEILNAHIKSARLDTQHLIIDVKLPKKMLPFLTELRLYVRTADQMVFRSLHFKGPWQDESNLLTCPLADDADTIYYYYVEFIGRYHAAMTSLGTVISPRTLASHKRHVPKDEPTITLNTWWQLVDGWPLLLGTALTILATLSYGVFSTCI